MTLSRRCANGCTDECYRLADLWWDEVHAHAAKVAREALEATRRKAERATPIRGGLRHIGSLIPFRETG